MKNDLPALRTDAWRTSGARYNAYRRLKRREFFSTASLAFFSAATAALAFVQILYSEDGRELAKYLTALTGGAGIFLLAVSLIEWGARSGARAERLFDNAEKLNAFQRKIGLLQAQADATGVGGAVNWDQLHALREEYERIKGQCADNHAPIDDELFRARQRRAQEFLGDDGKPRISDRGARWVAFLYTMSSVWYFGLCWITFAVLIAIAPWRTC